jgi:dTDP-4-amino-4,6-dideoxygalactose transaminase
MNEEWSFKIEQPKGWHITESSELIKRLKEQKQYQKIGLLKDSGLIVTFTKFPFNNKDAFTKLHAGGWKYDILFAGLKVNMPDVCAAIGLAQIRKYDSLLIKETQNENANN